ncbi:efflux RND transporter permease subunit [Opitutales bacterium ASA1]|uniref:efflux RND transporter permease subunit n=1 Tax=Congregicoccus parvus TaxID=3081749 RepID=UPI002B2E9634|nr:efflux RND transporter permease subunit [Opitutales bacterium ASA1]
MKLTDFSVRNHPFTLLVFLCLVALGVNAWLHIPRSEDPRFSIPVFIVVAVQPGSDPVELERLVVRPIEDALNELDDVDKVVAAVRDGVATVTIEFFYDVDVDDKHDEVVRQLNSVRDRLPAELATLEVRRFRTNNVAVMQTALVSPILGYGRLQELAEDLRRALERVPGVRDAQTWAYPEKEVRVSLDMPAVQALGIGIEQIAGAIGAANTIVPGGAIEAGERRFNLETSGHFADLDELRDVPLRAHDGGVVRIGDVARVEWTHEDPVVFGRFEGERALFVTARMRDGQNIFRVREGLLRAVEAFRANLPADVRLEVGFDQSENVRTRLGALQRDFLIAIGLVLVTLLPLGVRASLIVAVSIPLSLAIGLALLEATGFGLNQITIVGMVIALGLLVDDSIVVVENIARFRREGHGPVEAAIGATRQIAVAVVGTTATVVLSFVPLLMLPGGPGAFILSLPVSVVYTVVASMFVALTIIPFLASRIMRGEAPKEGNRLLRGLERGIEVTYRPLLHWAMGHRFALLGVAAVLVAGSVALVPSIGLSLFPKAGVPQFLIRIEAPEGAGVAATDEAARAVERILEATPEVATWFTSVGRGNAQVYYNEIPREQQANLAEIFVGLHEFDPRRTPSVIEALRDRLLEVPGVQIVLREFQNGPPIEAPIAVRVLGPELDELSRLARSVEELLLDTPGTENVVNPLRTARTDLKVVVDRAATGLLGIDSATLDRAVRLAVDGIEAGRFREEDGDEYAIRLVLPREERPSLDAWEAVRVRTGSGAMVPVSRVARLELKAGPPVIQRFNRERSATVTAYVSGGYNTAAVTREVNERMEALSLPSGYTWKFGGEAESREQSFGGFGAAILVAMFGVLAVIVLEFRSFRGTAIVSSVIPLGFVGGLVGLWLTGYTLSFMALVGFVALVGIEIKNSILLVDFTNQLRAKGVPLREAIERAGQVRFLPVVLTTLTALGALMPLALARSDFYSPLAIVIMGGLVSSLLLSRLVTPVLYSLIPPPGPDDGP